MDPAAHTDATRIGLFASRGGTPEVGVVVSGTQSLSVRQTGVVVTGSINASGTVTTTGTVLTPVAANPGGATTIWVDSAGNILKFGANPMIAVGAAGAVQFATGAGGVNGDATNFFWDNTLKTLALGSGSASARLDITGVDLSAAADGAIASIFTHTVALTKNDTNTRQFYSVRIRPTFNTGGSNANTTYDVLSVDTVNGTTTGLTTNLINLNYGGVSRFKVDSAGITTIVGVPYTWPGSQGAANSIVQNNGSGVLSWNVVSGDATLNGSGVLTLATTVTAGGPTGSGTVVPVITYDAKGRLTAVTTATITAAGIGAIGGSIANTQIAYGAVTANTIQGSATFLNVSGQITIGTATPNTAAALTVVGSSLTTQATSSVGSLSVGSTLTKNDANTRVFYDTLHKPTINAGAGNTTTTFNVIAVDTINAATTGVTTNLMNLAYGGTTKANIDSDGSFTANCIKTENNNKVRLGVVDLGYTNQSNTVVVATGNANQAGDANTIILGFNTVQTTNAIQLAALIGDTINATTTGGYHFNHYAMGQFINITDVDNTITLGFGVNSGSRLAPFGSNTINFAINSTIPTMYITAATGAGNTGSVVIGNNAADPTAKLLLKGKIFTTDADQSIQMESLLGIVQKNDANTRTFYGSSLKPTFNTGGSNTSTTYNILNIDSVNTSVTGLTVNLLNLNFGGSNVAKIDSTGLATFNGGINSAGVLTLSRNGSGTGDYTLGVTGTTVNNATSSQIRIGNAITGGNVATNGGTYLGMNIPTSGAGSAADLVLWQTAGVDALRINSTRIFRVNGAGDDVGGIPAQFSVAAAGANPAVFIDGSADTAGQAGTMILKAKGNVGASKVLCIRNSDHNPNFVYEIGSLGAMRWGSGDSGRDVQFSRVATLTSTMQLDNNGAGGNQGALAVLGQMSMGGSVAGNLLNATATIQVNSTTVNAQADQAAFMTSSFGNLTKNDANTRQFYGDKWVPTFNAGASNLNTTYNVLHVDTVNTSVTGLTVNLLSLNFAGANAFKVRSDGDLTAPHFRVDETNSRIVIGTMAYSFGGTGNIAIQPIGAGSNNLLAGASVLIGTGGANSIQSGGGNTLLLGLTNNSINNVNTISIGQDTTNTHNGAIVFGRGGGGNLASQGTNTIVIGNNAGSGGTMVFTDGGGVSGAGRVAINSNTAAASLDVTGQSLTTAADQSVASIFAHTSLAKNDANTRTFFDTLYKPTFNTGGSNTTTTYNVLAVDTVNTSVTGLTVNLLNLAFGGVNKFLVTSSGVMTVAGTATITGATTITSTSLNVGTVTYVWPSSQGAANTFLKNDGSGNLSWAAASGGVTGSGTLNQIAIWSSSSAITGTTHFFVDNDGSNYSQVTFYDPSFTESLVSVANTTSQFKGFCIRSSDQTKRWQIFADGSEGGGNSGSSFCLRRYTDAGALIDQTLKITRNSNTATWLGVKHIFKASTTALASINIPAGTAPTTPTDGDMWLTTTSLFVQVNGSTVQLGSGTIAGSIAANQVAYGLSSNTIQGSANLTYDGTREVLTGTISSGNLLAISATSSGTSTALNLALANSGGTSQTGINLAFSSGTASPTVIGVDMSINYGSSPTTVYGVRFQPAGSLGSLTTAYFLYSTSRLFANYWQGSTVIEHDQGASDPQVRVQGTWFSSGTATTNKPALLVEPLAATSTGWSTAGTGLGVNAASGFTGNLADLQLNGVSKVSIASTGAAVFVSTSHNIGNVTYVWPGSQGAASTVLTNDGSGNLSWATASAGAGGSNTQIQYNNSGALAGIAGFTYTPAGAATFDLNMSRTYTGSATGSNKYGTLNSTLSVTPTTTASGGFGYALRSAVSIDNVTGLASTNGTLYATESSITDASIVGGSWLGTIAALRVTCDIQTGSPILASFSAIGGAHNTFGLNVAVNKNYTGAATTYAVVSSTLSLTATGTVTNAYGFRMTGIAASSGAITNSYGLYIDTVSGTGITNAYGIFQADAGGLNSFAGAMVSTKNSAASVSGVLLNGTWFSGGSSTTTKPHLLIEPSGTSSTNWNTGGTAFGINANIAFAGNLVDLQVNGASYFRVDNLGTAIVGGLADGNVGAVSSSWSNGGSQVLQDNSLSIINTNTSSILSFTLSLPSGPIDGKICIIATAGNVVSFTLDGNTHTVNNAPTTLLADTSVSFEFFGGIWYRLY